MIMVSVLFGEAREVAEDLEPELLAFLRMKLARE
jgi:hypothetical protein